MEFWNFFEGGLALVGELKAEKFPLNCHKIQKHLFYIFMHFLFHSIPSRSCFMHKKLQTTKSKNKQNEKHTQCLVEWEKMRWKIYWIRLMCHLQSLTLGKTLFILELNRAQNATWQKCMFYKNKNNFDHKFCCLFCRLLFFRNMWKFYFCHFCYFFLDRVFGRIQINELIYLMECDEV
jgi:hypothetical protein